MRNAVLVLGLLLCANVCAQSRWEFSLYGGGGWSALLYDGLAFKHEDYGKGSGGLGGLGYTFFFSEYFGLGLGAEYAIYNNIKLKHLVEEEKLRIMAVQVPLMLQLQGGSWHKFYFGAGGKLGLPFNGTYKVNGKKDDLNLKTTSILASAEMGMKWQFKEHIYLHTGAYLDYGFKSMLEKSHRGSMEPVKLGLKLKLAFGGGSVIDPPVLEFSAGQDSILMGHSTVLNWIILNADSIYIEGIGPVADKGSVKVEPSETKQYIITARGRGGVRHDTVLVAVKSAPLPSVVFTASPSTIKMGQTAILNWMVSDADEVSMEGAGTISDKGSKEVKPSATTKYFLISKGKGGVRRDSVEIIVEIPPGPAVVFTAAPELIQKGQAATLNWITTDAEHVSIEGIGSVADKGSKAVKPTQTTKYTLTAKGKGDAKTQMMVEVIVEEPPPIEEKVNLKGVNFLPGKSVLSLDAKRVLDGVAEQLLAYPNVKIEIQGHTDNKGKEAVNRKLSEDRAKAVVGYLAIKGVKMNRMRAVGYGSNLPIADNSTEEGRELNRRIEMIRMD